MHASSDLSDGLRSVKQLPAAARPRYGAERIVAMAPRLTDFQDRVALVTGASSGIGAQLARDLVARGARVALVARRAERLEQLAAELRPSRALAVACDVASRPAVEAAVARVLDHWGRLDLLVNNAGLARHALFKDEDPDTFVRLMEINYLGTVWAIRAALPAMRRRGEGWIVNVSSVAGKLGQPDESAYTASKFAVTGLSEALASELGPLGIHVMTVYPALVRTEMFTPDVLARMPERVKRTFIEPPQLTAALLRGLVRGAYEVTVPRYVGIAYLMRLLFPGYFRRMTADLRLPVLPDLRQ
jgi:NAD(P)-dependent dehydrogenase (short-subunit alcohol dehydrogenase family)